MSDTLFPDFSQEISKLLEGTENDFNVLIQVGQGPDIREFRAHSLILCARSRYFHTTLSSKKDGIIRLKEIFYQQRSSPYSMNRYIYSGEIFYGQPGDFSSDTNQNASHALNILVAANELSLCKLVDYTQVYLIEKQSLWLQQNLTKTLQVVCCHGSFVKLRDHVLEIVCKNPSTLFDSDDFLRLDEAALIEILKRDDLEMCEVEIWNHVIRWGFSCNKRLLDKKYSHWSEQDFSTLEKSLNRCIPLIRFFQMPKSDYYENVRNPFKKILPNQLDEDVIRYHMVSDDKYDKLQSLVLPPRVSAFPFDSTIINAKDAAQIASWIDYKNGKPYTFGENPYKFKLIMRGSRDGFDIASFHKNCDDKEHTIIVIKVSGTGEVIGGYNPLKWKSTGTIWLEDGPSRCLTYPPSRGRPGYYKSEYHNHPCRTNHSFLFSFSDRVFPKLSRVLQQSADNAIFWDAQSGPRFGNADLCMIDLRKDSKQATNWISKNQFYEHGIAKSETFS